VTLIFFLCLMFGLLFVIRTMHVFRARNVIRANVVTKIGTVMLSALIWSSFCWHGNLFRALLIALTLIVSPLILFFILERKRIAEFKASVPIFLDRWILNLRLGNSVTSARDAALRDECEDLQALLRPVFANRASEPTEHILLPQNVLKEFAQIAGSTHGALARLENLRDYVRKTSEFRRKSGQATRQTAIQSLVMMVLLFALGVFTVHRYGWTRTADLVTFSALISFIGVALMFYLARKTRWNL